ncbi:MAG: hypothetical protein ACRERE_14185, partial [Candidatus Entotheonellia bacterium]
LASHLRTLRYSQTLSWVNPRVMSRRKGICEVYNPQSLGVIALLYALTPSGLPPAPGTLAHHVLLGKLAFFTGLGVPDNNFLSHADPRHRAVELPGQDVQRRLE